jgi:trimethylamine:corrinoid methyltransferase-like protein
VEGFTGKRVGTSYAITEEECRLIHGAVVRVLEQGGMRCDDPRAAKLFAQVGCTLEDDGRLVKIPEHAIDAAFRTCPGDFTIYGREAKNDVAIGKGEVHFATMTGRYIRDLHTGERRKATRRDAVDGARMADALENVHGLYKSVMWLYDEPKIINSQILVGEMMKNTTKGMTWVYNTGAPNEIPDLVRLWQIAAGGEEELRRKPHVLGHVIVNPPRVVDVNYTDWMIGFCDAGIPITVYSATMAGATGPATLAGMMVQVIAESVALVVLAQAYKPGHPLCFCSFNPSMDMRTGLWSFGNPEYSTLGTGIARMAKHYGIPCVAFGNTDSCDTDQQTAYEKALVLYNYALAGVSLTWTMGGTAGFNFVSWDQLVVDDEVASFIGHYLKGIRVDAERLSEDLILEVGPLPGSYMNEEHTRKWYREEFLMPRLSNRQFFETWERGHTELLEKAKEKARSILETHESPVPQAVQDEVDDYLAYIRRRDVDGSGA